MVEVTLDQCTCTCEKASVLVPKLLDKPINPWEIGIIVFVLLLIILALIIGYKKLRDTETEDEPPEGDTYY